MVEKSDKKNEHISPGWKSSHKKDTLRMSAFDPAKDNRYGENYLSVFNHSSNLEKLNSNQEKKKKDEEKFALLIATLKDIQDKEIREILMLLHQKMLHIKQLLDATFNIFELPADRSNDKVFYEKTRQIIDDITQRELEEIREKLQELDDSIAEIKTALEQLDQKIEALKAKMAREEQEGRAREQAIEVRIKEAQEQQAKYFEDLIKSEEQQTLHRRNIIILETQTAELHYNIAQDHLGEAKLRLVMAEKNAHLAKINGHPSFEQQQKVVDQRKAEIRMAEVLIIERDTQKELTKKLTDHQTIELLLHEEIAATEKQVNRLEDEQEEHLEQTVAAVMQETQYEYDTIDYYEKQILLHDLLSHCFKTEEKQQLQKELLEHFADHSGHSFDENSTEDAKLLTQQVRSHFTERVATKLEILHGIAPPTLSQQAVIIVEASQIHQEKEAQKQQQSEALENKQRELQTQKATITTQQEALNHNKENTAEKEKQLVKHVEKTSEKAEQITPKNNLNQAEEDLLAKKEQGRKSKEDSIEQKETDRTSENQKLFKEEQNENDNKTGFKQEKITEKTEKKESVQEKLRYKSKNEDRNNEINQLLEAKTKIQQSFAEKLKQRKALNKLATKAEAKLKTQPGNSPKQ